jgi:tetratricopeptide (TPR) repeat protein
MQAEKNMESNENKPAWTSTQVYVMAAICLLLGIAAGYLVRGPGQPVAVAPQASTGASADAAAMQQQPTPEMMKRMAEKKAEPLLAQLKSNPKDPQLLAEIGNIYYDTQNFKEAIDYYSKSLAVKDDPNVRTDLGTAYFYAGDADTALAEFERTLKAFPNFDNALFNIGMVKFQGKMDTRGAIAAWEQLLKQNPNHPRRADIEQMIANAKQHANVKPGQKSTKPVM